MTTALHAVLASTNVLQVQSQKAKSTQSTLTFVLTAALAQMFAPLVLLLRANNSSAHVNLTHSNCQAYSKAVFFGTGKYYFSQRNAHITQIFPTFLHFFFQKIWSLQWKPLSLHSKIRHRQKFPFAHGEMVEWSITAVLKTAVLRGTGGSNPSLSAKVSVTSCKTTSYADFFV